MDITVIKERARKDLKQNIFHLCLTLFLVSLIPFIFSIVEHFVTEPILEKLEELAKILAQPMSNSVFDYYSYHFITAYCAYYAWSLLFSLSEVFLFFFELSLCATFLLTAQGEKYKTKDFKEAFSKLKESFCLNLLKAVKVALWSLLFVIPGIIKFFAYSMANHVRLEKPELSANECLKESEEMMKGKKTEYFMLLISFIGWGLLYSLCCGLLDSFFINLHIQSALTNSILLVVLSLVSHIAILPLKAYIGVADAHFYLALIKEKEEREENFESDNTAYREYINNKDQENGEKTGMFDFLDERDDFIRENYSAEKENTQETPFSDFEETKDDTPFGDF